MKRLAIVALALALASPAVARCPYGQILRVSMGKCVAWQSRLAAGFVRQPRHFSQRRIVITLPPPPVDPAEPPEIEVLRERLAHRLIELTPDAILLSRAAALVERQ